MHDFLVFLFVFVTFIGYVHSLRDEATWFFRIALMILTWIGVSISSLAA